MPSVLIVNSPGPQGPVGPQGPSGSAGVFPTGSYVTTSSFNAFTGSYNTGSFTGSFTGDGIGLYNIPASGITGLNLSQIASGSYSASISPANGFTVNTNANINGALTASSAIISGNVVVQGTASINTLIVNQTQLSTGSNQLGDAVNDTQTLYGTVTIPTGSLTVTGSIASRGGLTVTTNTPGTNTTVKLSVAPNSANIISFTNADNTSQGGFLATGTNFSYGTYQQNQANLTGGTGGIALRTSNSSNAHIRFYSGNADADFSSEIARFVASTGNLLLNTTTDSGFKLDVSGSGRFTSNVQITGSLTIQPTSSATQLVSIIQAGSGSIALIPGISGSIVTSIPDGTAVGGNARGIGAVDLQTSRTNANQVASGDGSFVVGQNNRAANVGSIVAGRGNTSTSDDGVVFGTTNSTTNASQSSILGGYLNTISVTRSTIAGGQSNNITAASCFIGGGNTNTASSQFSVVSGGQSNTASTNTHATVVGGQGNTSSGQHSVSGGNSNTASGQYSTAFGFSSSASGQISTTFGRITQASGQYSFAAGNDSKSYLQSSFSVGGGSFASNGDAQQSLLTARREATLTTAASSSLSLDGSGTANLIIPTGNNRAWHTTIDTVATVTTISGSATGVTVGDSFMQTDKLLFKRIGGTSSVVGRSTTETIYDTSMSTALMSFTAGSSQELAITFTAPTFSGGGSITCRVVSKVSLVEVAY